MLAPSNLHWKQILSFPNCLTHFELQTRLSRSQVKIMLDCKRETLVLTGTFGCERFSARVTFILLFPALQQKKTVQVSTAFTVRFFLRRSKWLGICLLPCLCENVEKYLVCSELLPLIYLVRTGLTPPTPPQPWKKKGTRKLKKTERERW